MVCFSLILLSLLSPLAWAQIENLKEIVNFLQTRYGDGHQFAVAINVPAEKCSDVVQPDQNFLRNDNAQNAKKSMNSPERVYRGQELIGAKPKPIPNTISNYHLIGAKPKPTPNTIGNYHSEYLLLILSDPPNKSLDDPLMQKLLNRDPNGCVIFYTFNSPCVRSCSTPTAKYSIISALDGIKNHKGPKAFVFGQVWKHDENKAQWEMNMKEINIKVPLYRCDNAGCTRCVDNNNVVQARCKAS